MDVFEHGGGTYDLFDACHASLFQDPVSIWSREIKIQRVLKPCPVLDLLYLFQSLNEKDEKNSTKVPHLQHGVFLPGSWRQSFLYT